MGANLKLMWTRVWLVQQYSMYSTYYSEEKVKYAKIWKYIIQYIHIFYELLQGSALLHWFWQRGGLPIGHMPTRKNGTGNATSMHYESYGARPQVALGKGES